METKTCTKCGEVLEASPEYFYREKNGKYGLNSVCKVCKNKKHSEYVKNNREKDRAAARKYYHQNKDSVKKRVKEYEKTEKRKQQRKSWYEKNRDTRLEYHKNYYAENRDEYIEKAKIYREENAESIKQWRAENYSKNREKILAAGKQYRIKNKEKLKEYHRNYLKNNPNFSNEKWHRRRALLKNAKVGRLPKGYRKMVFNSTKGICWWCGCTLDENHWHMDHLIPLKKGGAHSMDNLVPSCPKCNLTKNDKLPHEFMEGRLL